MYGIGNLVGQRALLEKTQRKKPTKKARERLYPYRPRSRHLPRHLGRGDHPVWSWSVQGWNGQDIPWCHLFPLPSPHRTRSVPCSWKSYSSIIELAHRFFLVISKMKKTPIKYNFRFFTRKPNRPTDRPTNRFCRYAWGVVLGCLFFLVLCVV